MAEEVQLGRDAATLEVVMEAAGLLMQGQVQCLGSHAKQVGVPSQVAGLSQLSMAVAV